MLSITALTLVKSPMAAVANIKLSEDRILKRNGRRRDRVSCLCHNLLLCRFFFFSLTFTAATGVTAPDERERNGIPAETG